MAAAVAAGPPKRSFAAGRDQRQDVRRGGDFRGGGNGSSTGSGGGGGGGQVPHCVCRRDRDVAVCGRVAWWCSMFESVGFFYEVHSAPCRWGRGRGQKQIPVGFPASGHPDQEGCCMPWAQDFRSNRGGGGFDRAPPRGGPPPHMMGDRRGAPPPHMMGRGATPPSCPPPHSCTLPAPSGT